MTTALEAARKWLVHDRSSAEATKGHRLNLLEESKMLAALLDSQAAPLRAEIERLTFERDMARDEFAEARNTSYLERAEAAEERVRVLETEAKHLRAINDALNDKTQLLFEQLEAAEKS